MDAGGGSTRKDSCGPWTLVSGGQGVPGTSYRAIGGLHTDTPSKDGHGGEVSTVRCNNLECETH